MRTLVLVVVTAVLSGGLGGVLALQLNPDTDVEGLDLGLAGRLDALRGRLEVVEREAEEARRERAEARARAGAGPTGASAAEQTALRADLERLRAEIESGTPAAAIVVDPEAGTGESPVLVDLIDRRLRVLEEAKRERARAEQRENYERKVDAEVRRRVTAFTKQLQLSPDQSERLETSYQEAVEISTPLYGVLKNDQAGNDDRLAAIDRLRSNRRAFDERARSILSAAQYEGFTRMRAKEDETVGRFIDETEARIRGTTPPAR